MSACLDPRKFRARLLAWFSENARDLPWRRSDAPYAIWISEVMLQQTRVAAVLDHYARFMKSFPTLQALAAAAGDEVLAHWSGLGYYRRARLLHQAARVVADEMRGKLPKTAAELRILPGVGDYTSAAIASIGFGEAVACVDGNVERVLRRVCGWHEDSGLRAKIRAEAARLLDPARPGDFNQAMMELGATVCLPRSPLCLQCPVCEMCATRGEHPAPRRKQMRSRNSAYAFLLRTPNREAEVLLERRPADASLMPGMWELPSLDPKTAPEEAKLLTLRHSITNTNYFVAIYGLKLKELRTLSTSRKRWFPVNELPALPLTGLTRKVLKRLHAWPKPNEIAPARTPEPEVDQWQSS
jgi:A/G-specific adenine glycosylase